MFVCGFNVTQGLNPEDLPEEEQYVTVRKRFSASRMSGASGNAGEEGGDEAEMADSFGFGEGGFYTFHSFRRKAHDFRDKWFSGWHRFYFPCSDVLFFERCCIVQSHCSSLSSRSLTM
jgi:hypothetical protein